MKTKVKTETVTTVTIEITRQDLFNLFSGKRQGTMKLPSGAFDVRLYAQVPGGGDWSNTNLEIGEESNLFLEYKERTTKA